MMDQEKKTPFGKGLLAFLRKRGKLWLLLSGGLLGILLLLLGGMGGAEKTDTVTADHNSQAEMTAYCESVEKELEHLLEAVSGVSDVHVMVTLSEGYRHVFATDASGELVTVGSGASAHLTETVLCPPVITGVGIVCRGGSRAQVQQELVELVSATLGISSSRIYVTGK